MQRTVGNDSALALLCNFQNLELALKNKVLKTKSKAQASIEDLLFQDDEGFRTTPEGFPFEAPSIWGSVTADSQGGSSDALPSACDRDCPWSASHKGSPR